MEKTFNFENGMQADLELKDGDLLLVLKDVPGQPGAHKYHAANWIHAAYKNKGFWISPNWDDQPIVKVDEFEVANVASWINGMVQLQHLGEFKVVFVAGDSDLPF